MTYVLETSGWTRPDRLFSFAKSRISSGRFRYSKPQEKDFKNSDHVQVEGWNYIIEIVATSLCCLCVTEKPAARVNFIHFSPLFILLSAACISLEKHVLGAWRKRLVARLINAYRSGVTSYWLVTSFTTRWRPKKKKKTTPGPRVIKKRSRMICDWQSRYTSQCTRLRVFLHENSPKVNFVTHTTLQNTTGQRNKFFASALKAGGGYITVQLPARFSFRRINFVSTYNHSFLPTKLVFYPSPHCQYVCFSEDYQQENFLCGSDHRKF